jgi:hypothetical protein
MAFFLGYRIATLEAQKRLSTFLRASFKEPRAARGHSSHLRALTMARKFNALEAAHPLTIVPFIVFCCDMIP